MELVKFTVTRWNELPIDDNRKLFPINAAHVEYKLEGALNGTAHVEYLLYYMNSSAEDAHQATSRIAGFLHFEGTYKGQVGTFTAMEQGLFDKGNLDSTGTIVRSTGELENLQGTYTYKFKGMESELIFDFL